MVRRLKLAGLNCNGMRDTNTSDYIVSQALTHNVDVLFLQEHNLRADQVAQFRKLVSDVWWAFISPGDTATERGGSAILFRKKAFPHEPKAVIDSDHGDTEGGGICMATAEVAGVAQTFVSLYVPAQYGRRAYFISKLLTRNLFTPNMIVQGDFNCVADRGIDEARPPGESKADEIHGRQFESMFTQAGLTDAYRLRHGKHGRDYTRYLPKLHRRLDRFYAPTAHSEWRWVEIHSDPTLAREKGVVSDHLAVTAILERPEERPKGEYEIRINPEVMQKQDVRSLIYDTIEAVYSEYPTSQCGHGLPWEIMKKECGKILAKETLRKRPEYWKLAQLRSRRDFLYGLASRTHPDSKAWREFRKTEDEISVILNARKAAPAAVAFRRSLSEEMSSKQFYKTFSARFASSDITSMHVTPDWNQPEAKAPGVQATTPAAIAQETSAFFRWLFESKKSHGAKPLLDLLRDNPFSKAQAKKMEGTITLEEVEQSISSMAAGKSPGPDGLPAEFYQEFSDVLAEKLHGLLMEGWEQGHLHTTLRQGEIILLYKKGDPCDVRNYRPITLLTTDYKIFAKILTRRLKKSITHVVSHPQLGFVPGRRIGEGTHLLKLIQAALDEEEDEEVILVAADWEKAFDRVSWDYLHQAAEALGFGQHIRRMLGLMYNDDAPPMRRTRVNGARSDPFSIHSGIIAGSRRGARRAL